MSRLAAAALFALLAGAAIAAPATADEPAAPDRRKEAAAAFDAAVAALKAEDYERAADRFEAADNAVASAAALRQAIRARAQAGQPARAATLASEALDRYPGDEPTAKVAGETLARLEPGLYKLRVSCAAACIPAVGGEPVHGEAAPKWVVYLDPGKAAVSASTREGKASRAVPVDATAGGTRALEIRFDEEAPAGDGVTPEAALVDERKPRGLPRGVFFGGLAVTAALAGVTVWSGVDTQANPGAAAVHEACAGKGPTCPLYQDGIGREHRTNVLLGVTAGAAVATTVVGLFFTAWRPKATKPAAPPAEARRVPGAAEATGRSRPTRGAAGSLSATLFAGPTPGGALLGATGAF